MDRVPTRTRSRLSGRAAVGAPKHSKDSTGLESDSIFTRLWARLGRRHASELSEPLLPAHGNRKHSRLTTEDVAESPFHEQGGVPVEADIAPHVSTDNESDSEDEEEAAYYASRKIANSLTNHLKIAVRRQQLSLFLTKDGVLISIFSKDGSEIMPSLIARLRSKGTLLRTSEDASMLLQGIVDVCVDKELDIMDQFRRKIEMLEGSTMVSPEIATVRHLHVVSQQLSQMRGAVVPLQK